MSLKVLNDEGTTVESVLIDALHYVRERNSYGNELRIHGVNLSLGCDWIPRYYAAGQSPLCRELDLLTDSGVVTVVSAGNMGAGTDTGGLSGGIVGPQAGVYGQLSTITDPGNAASAITVGSTHRSRPHTSGVTYDSSKGPTLDGRKKPDLVAPGERITSAAAGQMAEAFEMLTRDATGNEARYVEDSGTSMAAAHVSGAIAAFLSARNEFIGEPERVKEIFRKAAIDLGRHKVLPGLRSGQSHASTVRRLTTQEISWNLSTAFDASRSSSTRTGHSTQRTVATEDSPRPLPREVSPTCT